jgi:hypothetical protein
MARHGYPPEFRRRVLDRVAAGKKISQRRQDEIDRGLHPGLSSHERAELTVAKRRITELETELAIHRRASELLQERADPKGGAGPSR